MTGLPPTHNPDLLRTRAGALFPGVKVRFGEHTLHEHMLDWPWMKLWLFSVTGREFPANVSKCIEALWVNTSYPEARVWNNRIAGVVASTRGTSVLGLSAAVAVSEAYIYGGQVRIQGERFIRRAVQQRAQGVPYSEILAAEMALHGRIAGFGRPVVREDERLVHTLAICNKNGLGSGPHLTTVLELMAVLAERERPLLATNGALMAAIGADMGFSAEEFNHVCALLFIAGMPAVQREWLAEPDAAFMPVACSQLAYDGEGPRNWVRSE
jgi:hypothetical protein